MYEDENKTQFQLIGQEPHMWLSCAKQLKKAADLVAVELLDILSVYPYGRPHYDDLIFYNSYMLLAGLSIENLTKGILIGRQPEIVSEDELKLNMLGGKGGHNIEYLAKKVNIPYTSIELSLLERLTNFVLWAGKYPIALKAEKTISPSFMESDIQNVGSLYIRFAEILVTERPRSTIGTA